MTAARKLEHSEQPSFSQLTQLMEAAHFMGVESDLEKLLDFLARKGAAALGADRCSIFMVDAPKNEIYSKVVLGEKREIRLKSGEGIAGKTINTGRVIMIPDAYAEPSFNRTVDKETGYKTRNILCAPMNNNFGKTIGCFEIVNKAGEFTKGDEELLQAFSNQAAKAIENALLYEEKEKEKRLSMLGQLVSTIIHDLKNPMGIISGYAYLLGEEKSLTNHQITDFAHIISLQTERCMKMIQELLAFATGEQSYTIERIAVRDFMDDILSYVKLDSERLGVRLTAEFTCNPTIEVDRDKLMRAVFNLTNNALDILKKDDSLKLSCSMPNPYKVEIRVTDSGPGIPENLRPKMFEAFFTHGKKHGTGLGLYICKDIVEHLGGDVCLDEGIKDGTSFVITLPLAKGK